MGRGTRPRGEQPVALRAQKARTQERVEKVAVTYWIERAPEPQHVAVEIDVAAYDGGAIWAYDIDEAGTGGHVFGPLTLEFLRRCLPNDLAELIANELQVPYPGRLA